MRLSPAARRRARLAIAVAGLAFACAWNCASIRRLSPRGAETASFREYSFIGEVLTHGIASLADHVSYRMPLASIVLSRLAYHAATRLGPLLSVHCVLLIFLIFALGSLLHPWGGMMAGPAGLLLAGTGVYFDHDPGYSLLILLAAGLLAWRARDPSPRRSACLAAAVGASLMWRSPLAFFTPALALYEWSVENRFSFRAHRKQLLILCLGPYLFLLPWIAMNWTISRRLVIFERGAADSNIVTGAVGLVGDVEGDYKTIIDEPIDAEKTSAVVGWAVRQVIRHPLRYARACVLRLKYALSPDPALALIAAAGFFVFRRRREFRALAFLAAYFIGIHCLMSVEERYFWPLWPLLAVLACSLPAGLFAAREPARADWPEFRLASVMLKAALAFVLALSLYANWEVLAFASLVKRGPREAEAEFTDALRSNPDDAWLLEERGQVRSGKGDSAGAERDFARAAELEPENESLQLSLARTEALLGKPERLLGWKSAGAAGSLKIDADGGALEINAEILKACAYLRLGRKDEAFEHLKSARNDYRSLAIIVRGPRGELGEQVRGKLELSDSGFVERFIRLRGPRPIAEEAALNELLVRVSSESSVLWIERAAIAAETGKPAQAAQFLSRAESWRLGRENDDAQWRRIALAYQDIKEYDRALGILARLMRKRPWDASLYSDKAISEYSKGAVDAAVADLRTANRLDPRFMPAYLTLGAVLTSQGRAREAVAAYDDALSNAGDADRFRPVIIKTRQEVLAGISR